MYLLPNSSSTSIAHPFQPRRLAFFFGGGPSAGVVALSAAVDAAEEAATGVAAAAFELPATAFGRAPLADVPATAADSGAADDRISDDARPRVVYGLPARPGGGVAVELARRVRSLELDDGAGDVRGIAAADATEGVVGERCGACGAAAATVGLVIGLELIGAVAFVEVGERAEEGDEGASCWGAVGGEVLVRMRRVVAEVEGCAEPGACAGNSGGACASVSSGGMTGTARGTVSGECPADAESLARTVEAEAGVVIL